VTEWVSRDDLEALHDAALTEVGSPGVRDESMIQAALMRPSHRAVYGDPDLAELAACYLFGLAKSHGFVDGNKRTAWLAARLFLELNGPERGFPTEDAVAMVTAVASGELSEMGCAAWLRERGV
jgi:death-on-curing protein